MVNGFIILFPWAGRSGFADVPPFKNAGIDKRITAFDHPKKL